GTWVHVFSRHGLALRELGLRAVPAETAGLAPFRQGGLVLLGQDPPLAALDDAGYLGERGDREGERQPVVAVGPDGRALDIGQDAPADSLGGEHAQQPGG